MKKLAFSIACCALACGHSSSAPVDPAPDAGPAPGVNGPPWMGLARTAQHSAESAIATQDLNRISWSAPLDLAQQNGSGVLLIHYGTPVVSGTNTVVLPVKTQAGGGFRIEARSGVNGGLIWSIASDWVPPPHDWMPSFGMALDSQNRLFAPASGGKLLVRDADAASAPLSAPVFYGASDYAANMAAYDASVFIDTPITVDAGGNAFFGFVVTGSNPSGLRSGIARISASGEGSWAAATDLAADPTIDHVAMNSAPAVSTDGATVYVAVSSSTIDKGYLLALDAATLAARSKSLLVDPKSGAPAVVSDNGTASPTVGPDGDVYFGVLESTRGAHNARGWLLHFDSTLATRLIPGGFGWDDTVSLVPAAMVPSYTGASSYLVMTKYNNYLGAGTGDGQNRVAVLDPKGSEVDPLSGRPIMREVLTILSATFEQGTSGPTTEWCVNTAAVDPATGSVLVNNEDGFLYRWDLSSNTFTQKIQLTAGIGEAYTPTAVGADGAVYAVSNSRLFSIAR